ncbi:GNAT family N-acetyltransferase [Zavarzinia sp. CC-PAN008]|uniref:GNAT family N-acetyltransferase n=1 Tax=Zavarzinia sp. CC-PAN008 TaxID=3243332 RepID=UPI003F74330C
MIETPRLRLRPLGHRDVHNIVVALNDWSVAQWLVRPPYPYCEADARDFISWARSIDDGSGLALAIADRANDALLGTVSIERQGSRAELGYWLASDAAGRGYATEAVAAVLQRFRKRFAHLIVFATIDPENQASARVLVKNGFSAVGGDRLAKPRKRGTSDVLLLELAPGDEAASL